jgi:hypothetical protein
MNLTTMLVVYALVAVIFYAILLATATDAPQEP